MKPALPLLLQVERETQAGGINSTLAGLAQPPYSPLPGQGVCDLCQACRVRDMSKTISFLCKTDAGFARLASHVLMPVQHHLGGEGRMPADLDSDVAPLGIENMERVMIDVRHRLLPLDVMIGADIPHRRLCAAHQNEKQPSGDLRLCQIFFGNVVLPLPNGTIHNWDTVGLGIAADAAAETARQAHPV